MGARLSLGGGIRGALVLSASVLLAPGLAQAQVSVTQLASQAHYWEEKGRDDLARESWLKLLRVAPDDEAALTGLAMAEARSGRAAAAQVYLDRLREKHPDAPGIRKAEEAIRSGAFDQQRLQGPRDMAREGRFDEAAAAYRQAFGGQIPEGRLGLEYWQTVAGTKDGWTPARDALSRLAKAHPDDNLYALALAQHLTYRADTRREGISDLARLSTQPGVEKQAEMAWRQGLLWLDAKPSDEGLYKSFLNGRDDVQVAAKLESLRAPRVAQSAGPAASAAPRAPSPQELRGQAVQQAYQLLNDNQITEAGDAFEQVMANYPNSEDAVGGLGIVRLRQERYGEARTYLEQASAMAPKTASRWREALGSARFWEKAKAAQAARDAGNVDLAEQQLRAAIAGDPDIARKQTSVKNSLADLVAENGDPSEAEQLYREVLSSNPDDASALRGLISMLVKTNRLPEALNLVERLPPDQKAEVGNLGSLKGQYLREQAKLASDDKDEEQAESLLKQALLEDPESPWTRLELSRIYQRQHRIREANTLIDGLLTGGKAMPDALYIKALLLAEQDNFYEGLETLERVPFDARTQSMADLQRRMWVRYQTHRAGVLTRYGQQQDAATLLKQVEPYAQDSAELLGSMATALADIGQDGPALNYIRQALSRQASPDPGLRMQYASLLFKLRQDAEFEVVLQELIKYPQWNEQQSIDLANLRVAYRLRQADNAREEGNLARAYEYLEPLLRVNPNDPRVIMALARLYDGAKEPQKSYELYRRVLANDANNLDAYKGAINALLSLEQPDEAQALLDEAIRLDPRNPRLYALAGRIARARGEDGRALQLFQQALQLDQEHGGPSEFGEGNYSPRLYLLDPASSPVNDIYYPAPGTSSSLDLKIAPEMAQLSAMPVAVPASSKSQRRARIAALPKAVALRKDVPVKVATRTRPLVARPAAVAVPVRARPRLAQGDVALVAMPRWWKTGRLIKVADHSDDPIPAPVPIPRSLPGSTAPRPQPKAVPAAPAAAPLSMPVTLPAQRPAPAVSSQPVNSLPAYVPRRLVPSNQLTLPPTSRPPAAPASSLRQEVLQDINDIGGQQPVTSTPAPVIYPIGQPPVQLPPARYPGALQWQQQLQQQQTQAAPVQVPAQAPVQAPVAPPSGAPGYAVPAGVAAGVGATEQEYAGQGWRVLPAQPAAPAAPARPLAPPMQTYVPRAPVEAPPANSLQLRSDPLLSTPDFVLQQRRPAKGQPNEVLREIADINAKRSPYIGMDLSVRNRDGQPGLDRLNDIEAPVEISAAGVSAGRIKFRAVPVLLDAGTVAGRQLPLFGAMALVNGDDFRFQQQESGVAVGVAYEIADLKLDFGSSPLGFPVETLVGGLNWSAHVDRLSWKIDLSRRSMTDSLLSYAGTRDPATGFIWGGVTKNGGRLDLAFDLGQFGVYANGSYYVLDGENVARNSVYEIGGGFYARALDRRDMRVTYGLNVTTFFYDKNLRRFTFGQGGYFSPQSYFAVAVPVEWSGKRGRFSYKLNGALGIQSFKEDPSAAFPNNDDLQAAIETFVIENPEAIAVAGYPSQNSTGIGFNFGGVFEYLLSPNLAAGARFGIDNARDYQEAQAMMYLRFNFNGQRAATSPPSPILPYYNFGDATQ